MAKADMGVVFPGGESSVSGYVAIERLTAAGATRADAVQALQRALDEGVIEFDAKMQIRRRTNG
jgi:hypothetical protein